MQRNNNDLDKKLVEDLEKASDKFGYDCVGPATSVLVGDNVITNSLRAISGCERYLFRSDKISKII
jgi:hypothetical protein